MLDKIMTALGVFWLVVAVVFIVLAIVAKVDDIRRFNLVECKTGFVKTRQRGTSEVICVQGYQP